MSKIRPFNCIWNLGDGERVERIGQNRILPKLFEAERGRGQILETGRQFGQRHLVLLVVEDVECERLQSKCRVFDEERGHVDFTIVFENDNLRTKLLDRLVQKAGPQSTRENSLSTPNDLDFRTNGILG